MKTITLTNPSLIHALRRFWDYINPLYRNPTKFMDAFGETPSDSAPTKIVNPHLIQRQLIDYICKNKHLLNAVIGLGRGEYLLVTSIVDRKLTITVHEVFDDRAYGRQVYDTQWVRNASPRLFLSVDSLHNAVLEPLYGVRWKHYADTDRIDMLLQSPLDDVTYRAWTALSAK